MKILTTRHSLPSARLLADQLFIQTNRRDIFVTTHPERILKPDFIRYGCSAPVGVKDTAYNPASFVSLCADKLRFSKVMSANGVYSPEYHREVPGDYSSPIMIRSTLWSSKGRGITVVDNEDAFRQAFSQGFFWTPFISLQFELRVHILGGQICKIFRKQLQSEEDRAYPIRNNQSCHFALRDNSEYPKLGEFVDTLWQIPEVSVGKFCTLDVAWDARVKKYFLIEMNSGSGLNDNTAVLYAQYLVEDMGIESRL